MMTMTFGLFVEAEQTIPDISMPANRMLAFFITYPHISSCAGVLHTTILITPLHPTPFQLANGAENHPCKCRRMQKVGTVTSWFVGNRSCCPMIQREHIPNSRGLVEVKTKEAPARTTIRHMSRGSTFKESKIKA
ncbi:MAG: hypothetical protein ACYSUB_22920 [Planctomycetota bacterium]|jgi:hypothetical protein